MPIFGVSLLSLAQDFIKVSKHDFLWLLLRGLLHIMIRMMPRTHPTLGLGPLCCCYDLYNCPDLLMRLRDDVDKSQIMPRTCLLRLLLGETYTKIVRTIPRRCCSEKSLTCFLLIKCLEVLSSYP
jgi:hypothetical protein